MGTDVMMLGLRSVKGGQGGVERHVDELSRVLDSLGLSVDILVRRGYDVSRVRDNATRITAIHTPRNIWLETIVYSIYGVIHAAIHRPAVLHIHSIGPSLVAPIARLCGLRVVTTHHGEDYNREKWGPVARATLRIGEWLQAYCANRRICVSRSLAERLTARYGTKFEYIPNGVNFGPREVGSRTLAPLGLTPGRYLLNVSRLVPEKRHLDLIQAFAKLQPTDLKLAIVGEADHETSYSQAVKAAAAAVHNVVMTGFQSGRELTELFANARLFILPSSLEGFSIALLEAMSYGRLLVVSDIPSHRELDLPEASYHRVQDVDDLARCIAQLLEASKGDDSRIPFHDWSRILEEYDWKSIGIRTADIYRAAADEANGGSKPALRQTDS